MAQELYLGIFFPIIILLSFGVHFIKNQKVKDWLLILISIAPMLIEWSLVYTTWLNSKGAIVRLSWIHLFPVYFCNLMMLFLIIVATWPHKESKVFNCFATFVAWGAIFGGLITNLTTYYGGVVADYSHTVMLFAGIYLFVAGYVKINVYNIIPFACGLLFCGAIGALTRTLFIAKGLDVSGAMGNCMFMYDGIPGFEALNGYSLAAILLVVLFIITATIEFFIKKKENRWYKTTKDIWLYLPKFNKENKKA